MILVLLSIFISSIVPDTSSIQEKTVDQIDSYIYELNVRQNVDLNLWAINEIATIDCTHLKLVQNKTQYLPDELNIFKGKKCEFLNTEEANDLHIEYSSKEIKDVFELLIKEEKKTISDSILSRNDNYIIHYKLLVERFDEDYNYENKYLSEALNYWVELLRKNKIENDLELSLITSLVIRLSFIQDKYNVIREFDDLFLSLNKLPYTIDKLRLLGALDYTYYRYSNYSKSLEVLREHSIPLANYLNNENMLYSPKNRQGAYLFELGKYENSKNIYENIYSESETLEKQYSLYTNLGISYLKLGESNKYLSLQLRALEKENEINNLESKLIIYRNLISYYTSVKDVNSVMNYFQIAKDLARKSGNQTELAYMDFYLASFYWNTLKDPIQALKFISSAESEIDVDTDYGMYIDLLLEKGYILLKTNSLNEAQQVFEESKKLALNKSDTPNYIDALVNLADINLRKGQFNEAKAHLDEINLYPRDNLDFELLVKYFTVKADYLSNINDNRQAIEVIQPVITQVIERAKNNTDSQQGFWTIEDEYLDAFQLILRLYLEENDKQNALTILEQFKTINDASLYNSPLIKANKLSESDLAEEKILSDRLQNLRNKYLNASEADRFEIKRQMDQVSAQREEILSKVEIDKKSSIPSLWKLQRSINPNELVLHFTEIGNQLYISYVTINEIRIKRLSFEVKVKERFNNIADDLASGFTNLEDLYELYNFLDLEIPEQTELITVIPDNYIYRIPLEVLPTRLPDSPISFGSTHYMLEDYHFRYFTSLKEYDGNRRTLSNNLENDFSAFSISNFKDFTISDLPSLPFATIESENIENALTSLNHKKIYSGDQATKEAFKASVKNSRLVHVATHSEVSEQNPLFSTIYLKNPKAESNLESEQALYAYELFDTPLNSEFIMLNSCSSGSGNYIQGSGIMGISRALRYAGAKSLALNLWSVNDKIASEFATDLYSYLNEGYTKSESIRMAKLNQLRSANANPHFWGAYMLIGNPSPITKDNNGLLLIVSLLSITSIFFGYTTYKKAA